MGLSAEKHNDVTEDQLDRLAAANDNEFDAKAIEDINEIRQKISIEMAVAKKEGHLSEKDFKELENKASQNTASKSKINQVAAEVTSVINESKQLVDSFVSRLTGEKDINKKIVVEEHIKLFKNFSLQEKRDYLNEVSNARDTLKSKLAWVETLYQTVIKYAPDQVEAFRRMNNSEKKTFVQDLEKKGENIKAYEKLIDSKGALFSKESKDEWMTMFRELKTVQEQDAWIKQFETETKNKEGINAKFQAFPKEIRDRFENDFKGARSKERKVLMQNMMRGMEEKHLGVLKSDPNANHFSESDRQETMKWWKTYVDQFNNATNPEEATKAMDILNAMMKGLPDHMKKASELSKKYEGFEPAVVKLDVQQKLGFNNFYELSFEQKGKAVEEGAKIKETSDLLVSKYKAKIDDAVSNKYMAKSSGEAFMKQFTKDCDLGEKMDWDNKFETHELAKRKAITEQFRNEVPKDLQEANQDFYELSYTERTQRLAKLLGIDVDAVNDNAEAKEEGTEKAQRIEKLSNDANRLEREGMTAENREKKKEKWTQALHAYQKLLKLSPEDDIAQSNYDRLISKYNKAFPNEGIPVMDEEDEISAQQFDQMLDKATSGSVMEENKRRLTIMKELVDREHTSENKNNQTFDTTKKQGRFESEFERSLNAKLVDHTDGQKIMNRDGKAQEVKRVDIKKMGALEQNQVYTLQREVTKSRGEKATKVDHIQFTDEQSGQKMNANTADQLLKKEEAKVRKEAAARVEQNASAQGIKLSKKEQELLNKRAQRANMDAKLQDAA